LGKRPLIFHCRTDIFIYYIGETGRDLLSGQEPDPSLSSISTSRTENLLAILTFEEAGPGFRGAGFGGATGLREGAPPRVVCLLGSFVVTTFDAVVCALVLAAVDTAACVLFLAALNTAVCVLEVAALDTAACVLEVEALDTAFSVLSATTVLPNSKVVGIVFVPGRAWTTPSKLSTRLVRAWIAAVRPTISSSRALFTGGVISTGLGLDRAFKEQVTEA
jgi:hypothetical protein